MLCERGVRGHDGGDDVCATFLGHLLLPADKVAAFTVVVAEADAEEAGEHHADNWEHAYVPVV